MVSGSHFSVSKQIDLRFNRRRNIRHAMAAVYLIGTLIYLCWRITIINSDSPIVSLAYYLAEWIGFVLGLTVIFSAWRYTHHETDSVPQGLCVDVLIPTYREPFHIIRRTIMAARDIDYPHQTIVLDDANRQEIKSLCHTLGVIYLARGENINAKAGNLNYGLLHSHAEFIAVFDADHIAQPHALHALLGLMSNDRIAMVQTPQDYYNTDAFQYLNPRNQAGLWHDQSCFYNLAQSCRDSWNAATCVGTGVLYRRTALNSIGGIPVDTVTEDFHTSLKLHKHNWQTRYLNEPVAYGIAAADLGEYYKTRHRWAHGNLATLKHEHIFTCSGLTLRQRLSYLSLGLIYLEGWQQLLLFTIPIFALVLGWAPFEISLFNVLVVLFYPIIGYLVLQEFGCGFSRFWTNELFAMARWPVHLASAAALFGRKLPWRSSSKSLQGRVHWQLMAPQLAVLSISSFALAYAIWRLHENFVIGPLAQGLIDIFSGKQLSPGLMFKTLPSGYSAELVAIAGFWALFNIARAGAFLTKALLNARRSHNFFHFNLPLPATLALDPPILVQTVTLAENFIRLTVPFIQPFTSQTLALTLHLPDGPLHTQITIDRHSSGSLDGQFIWENDEQRDRLAATLYSIDWHRELQNHHAYFLTPSDIIARLLGRVPLVVKPNRNWHARLVSLPVFTDKQGVILTSSAPTARNMWEIISFDPLPSHCAMHDLLPIEAPLENSMLSLTEMPISSLPHRGLNGKRFWRYTATTTQHFITHERHH